MLSRIIRTTLPLDCIRRNRRALLWMSGIFCILATYAIINSVMVVYWYLPAKNWPTYSSYSCQVYQCNSTAFSTNQGIYLSVQMEYGINNYMKNTTFSIYAQNNYCNITTTVRCYYYDDDISSLTLTEDDLIYYGLSAEGILLQMIVVIDIVAMGTVIILGWLSCWWFFPKQCGRTGEE